MAVARPKPRLAPVTIAVEPDKSRTVISVCSPVSFFGFAVIALWSRAVLDEQHRPVAALQSPALVPDTSRCELATALAISARRISRNVTGTAAHPVSPHTHRAHWNPPVRADEAV